MIFNVGRFPMISVSYSVGGYRAFRLLTIERLLVVRDLCLGLLLLTHTVRICLGMQVLLVPATLPMNWIFLAAMMLRVGWIL